ncbi:MAG: electron transfer flavoprotein subunit alpha/FixB family protein [Dehalococcoidales bacterium]|nr:MAG: electron transfer flavoprotein subunit alpha/FixB family protein [Dehalococcoidales bacterium]
MADNNGVLIICEIIDGNLSSLSTELLGCGKKLADASGQGLSAVLVGSEVSACANEAAAWGADKLYVVEDALLADYQAELYVAALEKVAGDVSPAIILLGNTSTGSDIAPRLANKLKTKAVLDCVALEIDTGSNRMLQTKPVYGGNAQAVFITNTDPQIVTVRAKSMTPLEKDDSRQAEVVNVTVELDASIVSAKVTGKVREDVEGIKLEEAAVVIAGGRGIGSDAGFKQLEELATVLKGAVGGTRPACDAGWIPDKAQIGLTAKIVSPELYIAVGISGASQHMAGCSGAKTIVAVNKDPEANIFRMAHYGVVGDWKTVLPSFIAKVKELSS